MRNSLAKVLFLACCSVPTLLAQNWNVQNPAGAPPSGLYASTMVYDPVHHQTVLFGGVDSGGIVHNDTYLFDGSNWTSPALTTKPSTRLWHSMAFDAISGTVILFGGCSDTNCTTYLGDTWSWNGTAWSNVTPAMPSQSPSPRYGAALSYAPNVGVDLVLFGGQTSSQIVNEVWIWDGTAWTQLQTPGILPRIFSSMSYDPNGGDVVLFGGQNGSTLYGDTWLFDGLYWNPESPTNNPPGRSTQGQVYDPVRKVTVMFGGGGISDTWLFDCTTLNWTQETTIFTPSGRFYPNLVYDTQHANTVLFGGKSGSSVLSDTWTLSFTYSSGWMPLDQQTTGQIGSRANMASASNGVDVFLFGGLDNSNVLHNDLWTWNGVQYSQLPGTGAPSARENAVIVYSPSDSGMLLFGGGSGAGGQTPQGDTYLYQSGSWNLQTPAYSPSARIGPSAVYDAHDNEVIMFGGYSGGVQNDTYAWKGSAAGWVQLIPPNTPGSPAARLNAAMVYDAARSQVLMFGGSGASGNLSDTWVFQGGSWTQLSPGTTPPARYGASLVYDSIHGTVLMFGGEGTIGPLADMWQWDGVNWIPITNLTYYPNARYGAAAAFDAYTQQFFLFGGNGQTGMFGDTWIYASPYFPNGTDLIAFSGQSNNISLGVAGGFGTYTFTDILTPSSFSAAGLTLNTSTGQVTGTDTLAAGGTPIVIGVNVTDGQGQSSYVPFTLITDNPIVFSPSPPQDATAGTTYTYNLTGTATGGTPPFRFILLSGPSWISGTSGTTIGGQCTTNTTGQITLLAIDAVNGQATAGPFTVNCNPTPQITNSATLANATLGSSYSVQLNTNAVYDPPGAAPYVWSVTVGSLPPGLTLNSGTGMITGSPTTAANNVSFTVTFTDVWGASANKQFQISVVPPYLITTAQLAVGNLNVPYPVNQFVTASGGAGGYTYSVLNALPAGLLLNSATGAITGTPTAVGTVNVIFKVTDSANNTAQATIPMYVVNPGSQTYDWAQLSPTTVPGSRTNGSMFYDSDSAITILFGGAGPSGGLSDTYSWNGTNWTALPSAGTPGNLQGAAVAYDPVNHQGVLFGGLTGSFNFNANTWLFNDSNQTWTPVALPNSPPARFDATMFWDGQRIVLYGGSQGDGDNSDTWTWDGHTWTSVTIASPPPSRQSAAAAYNPASNQAVLFGGYNVVSNTDFSDTWIWNPSTMGWTNTNLTPANSPAARSNAGMAYDAVLHQTILFGGSVPGSANDLSDTWQWNGTAWTTLAPLYNPGMRDGFALSYDPARGQIVLFGGNNPTSSLRPLKRHLGVRWTHRREPCPARWNRRHAVHRHGLGDRRSQSLPVCSRNTSFRDVLQRRDSNVRRHAYPGGELQHPHDDSG